MAYDYDWLYDGTEAFLNMKNEFSLMGVHLRYIKQDKKSLMRKVLLPVLSHVYPNLNMDNLCFYAYIPRQSAYDLDNDCSYIEKMLFEHHCYVTQALTLTTEEKQKDFQVIFTRDDDILESCEDIAIAHMGKIRRLENEQVFVRKNIIQIENEKSEMLLKIAKVLHISVIELLHDSRIQCWNGDK